MSELNQVGFIGGGNMAEGIVAAAVRRQVCTPSSIVVSDPIQERREWLGRQFGVGVTADNREVMAKSQVVVLAVKPQSFQDVAAKLVSAVRADHLLVSIMAGVSTRRIEAAFPSVRARVVRVMPNLPIRVGAGMAGVCRGQYADAGDIQTSCRLFDAGGASVVIDDESLMDAVTAISGSGPAYFYYFVEQMVRAGVELGLKPVDALKLAEYTCLGAAQMMIETGEPPADLRAKVTSKGGTTQAALERMAAVGVDAGIREAVKAAFQRGRELGS